jgi:hypothetical protein
MELIFLIGYLSWILIAWKKSDWRHIDKYVSTIYFFISASLLYFYLTAADILWRFESPTFHIKHSVMELGMTFVVFPCVALIFLTHYPQGVLKQVLYNLSWALMFGLHEWIVYSLGLFTYFRGWNLWWSLLVDVLTFPMLRLNQLKPVYAYVLLLLINALFFLKFGNWENLP